jgi:hypothetical protein
LIVGLESRAERSRLIITNELLTILVEEQHTVRRKMDEIDLEEKPQQFTVTLEKKGRTRGRFLTMYRPWAIRRFTLDQHLWSYYDEQDTLKGTIDLIGATCCKISPAEAGDSSKAYAIKIQLLADCEQVIVNAFNEITRELVIAFIRKAATVCAGKQDGSSTRNDCMYAIPFVLDDHRWLTSCPDLNTKLAAQTQAQANAQTQKQQQTQTQTRTQAQAQAPNTMMASEGEEEFADVGLESDMETVSLNTTTPMSDVTNTPTSSNNATSSPPSSSSSSSSASNSTGVVLVFHDCFYVGAQPPRAHTRLRAEGVGTAYLMNGDIYEGQFGPNNKFHGHGTLHIESVLGMKYDGEFVDGKYCGMGTLMIPGEYMCEGQWKDNKLCGYGKTLFKNGYSYEGEYGEDGVLHGVGSVVFPNKDVASTPSTDSPTSSVPTQCVFVGEFINGQPFFGLLLERNGDVYIGGFEFSSSENVGINMNNFVGNMKKSGVGRIISSTSSAAVKSASSGGINSNKAAFTDRMIVSSPSLATEHTNNGRNSKDKTSIDTASSTSMTASTHSLSSSQSSPTSEQLIQFECAVDQLLENVRVKYRNQELLERTFAERLPPQLFKYILSSRSGNDSTENSSMGIAFSTSNSDRYPQHHRASSIGSDSSTSSSFDANNNYMDMRFSSSAVVFGTGVSSIARNGH